MRRMMLLVCLLAFSALTVNAQAGSQRAQNASTRVRDLNAIVDAARRGVTQASPEVSARIRQAFAERNNGNSPHRLAGTWNIVVPGDAPFEALQTFNEDGTFVETSSILGTLTEGPAHGVWEYRRRGAVLTFELFAFDPDGNHVGRIRVRCAIRLTNENNLTGDTAVDFIELDGTVIADIATGPFYGTRMRLRGLND